METVKHILFPHPHMPTVHSDTLFYVFGWPVSNTTTFLFLTLFFVILFSYLASKWKEVPNTFQSLIEIFIETIENLMKSMSGGREHRVKELLFPIATIFLVVAFINIIGSFPIISQFTWPGEHGLVPFFKKATADINVTLPLALAIVLSVQFFGIKNWGFFGYFSRFFPFHHLIHGARNGFGAFALALIEFFVGLLEFISEIVKVISLSLRLFGNMFAGEILLAILTGIFAIGLPALWLGFDFMVAVIQTIVIGCLTAVYYLLVVKEKGQKSH